MSSEFDIKLVEILLKIGINSRKIKKLISSDILITACLLLEWGVSKKVLEKLIDDNRIELVCVLFEDVLEEDRNTDVVKEYIRGFGFDWKVFLRLYFLINSLSAPCALGLNLDDENLKKLVMVYANISDEDCRKSILDAINRGDYSINCWCESIVKIFIERKELVLKKKKIPSFFLEYLNSKDFMDFINRETILFAFLEHIPKVEEKRNLIIRLFKRKLTLQDYIRVPNLREMFRVDDFIVQKDFLAANFIFNKDNIKLMSKYNKFFAHILSNDSSDISSYVFGFERFESEDEFIRAVRDYYINEFNMAYLERISDYLSEFKFEIVEFYTTIDEMLTYNNKTFIKDSGQRSLLMFFSLEEIKKLKERIRKIFGLESNKEGDILNLLGDELCGVDRKKTDILEHFYRRFLTSIYYVYVLKLASPGNEVFFDAIKNLDIDDEDCRKYFTLGELYFIKYFKDEPKKTNILLNAIVSSGQFINLNKFISDYFDEFGLSLDFYKVALKNRILLNALREVDENYLEKYDEKEQRYIKVILENTYIKQDDVKKYGSRDNIDKYFGENVSEKVFFRALLSDNVNYIFKMSEVLIDEVLSEKDKVVYEILAESKSELGYKYYNFFCKFVEGYETDEELTIDRIREMHNALFAIKYTNSREIKRIEEDILRLMLSSNAPYQLFQNIEAIFIKNELPTVGKIYKCFEFINGQRGDYMYNSRFMSPVLKYSSSIARKIIIFSDLIKITLGSNNRSINGYLNNIKVGTNLYAGIKNGQLRQEDLNENQRMELVKFRNHLETLYHNSLKGQRAEENFKITNDVVNDIRELSKLLSPNGTLEYNLADRIISMFCHFAGFDTVHEVEEYIRTKISDADVKNRLAGSNKGVITLEIGDYVKGINDIKYLGALLQNGVRAVEYLGWAADSDQTPLDADVSVINSSGTIGEQIKNTKSSSYGPIWFVLKKDDRFTVTRDDDERKKDFDLSKLEVFKTSVAHGIRTGFASSEINYIVCEKFDPRIGLEIVMNGFYIPVVDMSGRIIFTPEDYDELRSKMSGLSYYSVDSFTLSSNLVDDEIKYIAQQISLNKSVVDEKRRKIYILIEETLQEFGLKMKTTIDGDLTNGYVEVIDTGSTGRNTNKIGDGDFDFMIKLDKSIISDHLMFNSLKNRLREKFNKVGSGEVTSKGDFRFKQVKIDEDTIVDIDMSFVQRTDEIEYSTDMALKDRLSTIYRQNPEQYEYVLANIILAKQLLSQASAYKSAQDGGLGGVGVENWILQNGGSFYDAVVSFLSCAEGKNFEEFKASYYIWDFGAGHYAVNKGQYPYRNFVDSNMTSSGYDKMVIALKEYIGKSKSDSRKYN